MKKILTSFFAFVICFSLCAICRAENNLSTLTQGRQEESEGGSYVAESGQEERDLEEYITERVVPVIIGVATSSLAFVTVLGSISRALKGLKDTKETFSGEAKDRQEAFREQGNLLSEKLKELEAIMADVPHLKEGLEQLKSECELLAQILTLGFSANPEIIKSGKGKKMSILLENAKCKMQNAKSTTLPSAELTPPLCKGRLGGPEKEVRVNEKI